MATVAVKGLKIAPTILANDRVNFSYQNCYNYI